MKEVFEGSKFTGDIGCWDVSKVENIGCVFFWSKFNNDILSS